MEVDAGGRRCGQSGVFLSNEASSLRFCAKKKSSKPLFLEGHWAEISQRRMQPPGIVKPQPIDHLFFFLTARRTAHSVQPLDLQRAKERLGSLSRRRRAIRIIRQDKTNLDGCVVASLPSPALASHLLVTVSEMR
jgi:hypothetical protein